MINTDHLSLRGPWVWLREREDGDLWHDEERLYRLNDGHEWPADLGPEPDWFAGECNEIDDALADECEASMGYDWTRRTAYTMATEGGRI